jgi:multimeric flavodoxin WrbA
MTTPTHGDGPTPTPEVRKGQGSVQLSRDEFAHRYRWQFHDPAFEAVRAEIDRVLDVAWPAYDEYRKSPRARPAGPGYADPAYELADEWRAARAAIDAARERHEQRTGAPRVLLVCAASRSDQTCPGEMSKTFRLVQLAREVLERDGCDCDVLDLSHLASQYGRVIYPCKACVSTAMPLCHWPCSCYPNHALGQVRDWMNELYPRWVEAHGVLIVTPVYWYQVPSGLKLMMDRLVCADGGNPDPTTTGGKDPARAKRLELDGWHYPRHLAGRAFGVVVHGDAEGALQVRRAVSDWLKDMHLEPAAELDRYIGYYEPYATSHEALDRDASLHDEVRRVATLLSRRAHEVRTRAAGAAARDEPAEPRPK